MDSADLGPSDGSGIGSPYSSTLNSLLGFGENLGTSLFNAGVVNPLNAKTAQQSALAQAQITSSFLSQIFFYGLIFLVAWLVIGGFERK